MVRSFILMLVLLTDSSLIAADKSTRASEPFDIEIPDCTVSLIHHAMLATSQPGVVDLVSFQEGDTVKEGELVARLRNEVAKSLVDIARKQVDNDMDVRLGKKIHEVAKIEHQRGIKLNERGKIITEEQLLQRKMTADQASIEIEKAQHELAVRKLQLAEAQARLDEHEIEAPFSGTISRVFKSSGLGWKSSAKTSICLIQPVFERQ